MHRTGDNEKSTTRFKSSRLTPPALNQINIYRVRDFSHSFSRLPRDPDTQHTAVKRVTRYRGPCFFFFLHLLFFRFLKGFLCYPGVYIVSRGKNACFFFFSSLDDLLFRCTWTRENLFLDETSVGRIRFETCKRDSFFSGLGDEKAIEKKSFGGNSSCFLRHLSFSFV